MDNDIEYTYNDYINDVSEKKIKTCKAVQNAVKRHLNDLKKSKKDFPYYFDEQYAKNAINFFCEMVHTQGDLALTKLKPEPWQQFIIASIYGWRSKETKLRRFNRAYIQMARKQGKSFLASAVGLYDLISEPGAQVVSAATKREQAKIVFNDAKNTVKYSKMLSKYISTWSHALTFKDGSFTYISNDSKTTDGLNPSCAIIDELHAHKTDDLLNVLQSGMGARKQPLLFLITTAGHDLSNPCYAEYERVEKMLAGAKGYENEKYFGIIYELDKGDSPENKENWIKANPNLGVSVSVEGIENDLKNAKQKSTAMAEFLTKRMNIWVNNNDCWIDDQHWSRCIKKFDEKQLTGLDCWGGIDLSKTTDFTAYTLYFNLPNGKRYAKHRFYIPKESIEKHLKTDTYLIENWIKAGYIRATDGETVDYDFMFEDIRKDASVYNIKQIAYDRNLSSLIIGPLAESYDMVEFNQSKAYMSEPSKAWETAITKSLIIDPNPVMRWMVSCATIYTDANDNIKVVKPEYNKSSKRIDGVITSIMANCLLEVAAAENEKKNINVLDYFN